MSFDNSKYDIELNGVPYRISNYQKSEATTFIPRLSPGSQTESEFDALKSKTIQDFTGGMLQRYWTDDHAIFGSENLFPIYGDGTLYPVKSPSALSDIMGKAQLTAKAQNASYLFLGVRGYSGTNGITRVDKNGNKTSMTLPASLSSATGSITDMVIWNNQLWISCISASKMFYMDLAGTTVTEVTGGGGCFYFMAVFQGLLYGTGGGTGGDVNVQIYKYTGDTTTRSFVSVGTTGTKVDDYNAACFIFNGRLYLTRTDGMWAYDGIRLAPVDDASRNVDVRNFRYPTPLKGYLYYFMADGFYRFNGNMVEKLYDISEVGFPKDVCAGKNRLWIIYSNSQDAGSSRYDKSMGYDFSSSTQINGRIAAFDGKAMFTYARTQNNSKPSLQDLANQGENDRCVWFNNALYTFTYFDKTTPGLYFYLSTDELSPTGMSSWKLLTSIFDDQFPMVDKDLENLEIVLDGNVPADETITIEYRTSGFADSTGWATLGTFKTQSKLREYVFRSLPAGINFRAIQLRLIGATTYGYGVKKLTLRYLVMPDFKWSWNFTLLNFGDNTVEPLLLKDGTKGTQSVALLRGTLYDARGKKVPSLFVDIDQHDLSTSIDNVVTTLPMASTSLLKSSGFVKIDDEIIYYAGKTSTSLTGCERGLLGTSPAAHTATAPVFALYRVIVDKFQNERIEMDDSDLDRQFGMSKPSQISLILREA